MSAQMIQSIGSALLHFFWQGAALAVLLLIAISFTRNPRVRYGLGVATLSLMAICPLVTLAFLERTPVLTSDSTYVEPVAVVPAISNITVALTTQTPVTSFDLLSCLVWIWCAGVCLFSTRAFGGWLVLQKLRSTAQEAISSALLARCHRLQQQIGIKMSVRFAYSEVVDAPAVVGWFRPVVLIPLLAMSGLSPEQLEAIIAHELAHIRRYDALVNLFQIAVETVLFYHPAVWWVNRVIRTERENCCDDIAVSICGNPREYAHALANMGGAKSTWAIAANGGALKARVGRLLGMQKITHGIPRAGLAVIALMCASCILLAAGSFKQDPPPPPPFPEAPPATLAPPTPLAPSDDLVAPAAPNRSQEIVKQTLAQEQQESDLRIRIKQRVAGDSQRGANERVVEMQRAIAAMRERYTSDYPELLATQAQLAALKERILDEQSSSDQKPEEHKGVSYIDSLASVGLTNLSVDDLIALKIQGVTAEYVRQMKAAGFDSNIHDLIGMKIQGVSPEYIRDIRATGLNPNTHEIVEMKIQGVTPEYVRQMKAAGFDSNIHDLIGLKIQGVSAEYIRDIRATGLNPNAHEIVGMKIQGVTPEFVRAMQSAGFGDLKIHDIVSARIQGITPEFVAKVKAHGFKDLTFHQLLGLKMADVF